MVAVTKVGSALTIAGAVSLTLKLVIWAAPCMAIAWATGTAVTVTVLVPGNLARTAAHVPYCANVSAIATLSLKVIDDSLPSAAKPVSTAATLAVASATENAVTRASACTAEAAAARTPLTVSVAPGDSAPSTRL